MRQPLFLYCGNYFASFYTAEFKPSLLICTATDNSFFYRKQQLLDFPNRAWYNKITDNTTCLTIDENGGSDMICFDRKQFGLLQMRFLCRPPLWRGRIKTLFVCA